MATGNIIGKVNNPVSPITYTGEETNTASVIIDNTEKTIAVDVKVSEVTKNCPTKAELNNLAEDVEQNTSNIESLSSSKQDLLVSGTNIKTINGNIILGPGNIELKTCYPFEASWPTTGTTESFCNSINYNPNTSQGMIFLGKASWSDLPDGLSDVDVIVEVLRSTTAISNKTIKLSVSSNTVSPYHWEYIYKAGHIGPWIGFQPELVSGENIKTINNESIVGSGNIDVVTDLSDYSTTEETQDMIDTAGEEITSTLSGVIEAETSRAEQAESGLSEDIVQLWNKQTQYFKGIVSGEHVDEQVTLDKSWCPDGSMVKGGDVPSTTIIRFTQTSNKALYIKSIHVTYYTYDESGEESGEGIENQYDYIFTQKQFSENNQTLTLDGITWTLSDSNNVSYFAYNNNYGQQVGSGSLGIRNCTLSTTDFAGCLVTSVSVECTGAASTNCKAGVEVGNDTWLYHEGQEDESEKAPLSPNSLVTFGFTHGSGSKPGKGEIITFHNVFLQKNRTGAILTTEAEERILYINEDNYLIYMYTYDDGLFVISKTLGLGTSSTTAYRGDWGQTNYNDVQQLKTSVAGKATVWETSNDADVLENWIKNNISKVRSGDIIICAGEAYFISLSAPTMFIIYHIDDYGTGLRNYFYHYLDQDEEWSLYVETETPIGGTKLYKHTIEFTTQMETILVISAQEEPYTLPLNENVQVGYNAISILDVSNTELLMKKWSYDSNNQTSELQPIGDFDNSHTVTYSGAIVDTVTPL